MNVRRVSTSPVKVTTTTRRKADAMARSEHNYRISDETPIPRQAPERRAENKPRSSAARVTLWVLVLVGIVANGATTFSGFHPVVSAIIGGLTLVCVVFLILNYVKNRK